MMSILGAPFRLAGNIVKSAGEVVKSTGRFVSELGGGKESPPPSTDPICPQDNGECHSQHNYHSLEEANLHRREQLAIESEALKSKQSRERQTEIDSRLEGGRNAVERKYYQVAITEFERVLTLSPGHNEAQDRIKMCYRYHGDELYEKLSYFEALNAYIKAGFDQGVQEVIEGYCARAETLEQVADAKGDTLQEVESALKDYVGINETFSKLEKRLLGKHQTVKLSLHRESIQKKIEQAKGKIQTIEARNLVQKADQMIEDFKKAFQVEKQSKASLEGFRKHLEGIDLIYIQARHKDRTCLTPQWAQLSDLTKEINGKMAQCRKDEVLEIMNECFAFLEKSSLKEERLLDSIIKHSENWLDCFPEAIRFPGVDKEQMKQSKEIVERVNRLATVSQTYVKNPWTFLAPIVNQAIHDFDENCHLSENHRKALEEHYNQMFANNRNLRKALIGLSPSGYQQLKIKIQTHLKTRIVRNSCLGCFPSKNPECKLNPRFPIREEDLIHWLEETRPEHFLKDIGDRFQAGAVREESVTEVEGEGEGMQEISLLRTSPSAPYETANS